MADGDEQQQSAKRGPYAKGRAKRDEILTRALDVVSREGYRGASVREIADAVGLSQAGLLHYFDSKEELFTAILRKRDERDAVTFPLDGRAPDVRDVHDSYLAIIRHNAQVPGLVQLFSRLSVDATDPEHPAHGYFSERNAELRGLLEDALRRGQASGQVSERADAAMLARMFLALADGMQLQWLLDPTVDMTAPIAALLDLIETRPDSDDAPANAQAR